MKFVKLSVLALAMGLFVVSCGNNETPAEETPMEETPAMEAAPEAPAPVDTMAAMPVDSSAAAATPAH